MTDTREIDEFSLSGLVKGVPQGIAPFPLREVGAKGWNLLREDLPLPAAILKASAIAHNEEWMHAFLALSGAVISPHGKTTMSPQRASASRLDRRRDRLPSLRHQRPRVWSARHRAGP